mgnify:CR=1 FL=1
MTHDEAPATEAVGVPAVMHALEMSIEQMGLVRSARTLLRVAPHTERDGALTRCAITARSVCRLMALPVPSQL